MTGASRGGRSTAPGREIRRAWEQFNSDDLESAPATLNPRVLASWRRCRLSGVKPDVHVVPHDEDIDTDSRFRWAALPVLEDLAERLGGTPNAILLADRRARMIRRWVVDEGVGRRLDKVFVSEGFRLAEDDAGTNGLGSPAEERRPFIVNGPEHFREAFHDWTCVGSPVFHPVTRQLEGIIDISCLYRDTNDLIMPLVLDAVRHVEERLFRAATRGEQTLLRHFLPAAGSATRAVTVLSDRTIISNPLAARLLQNVDQSMLWEHVSHAVASHTEEFHTIALSEDNVVEARCSPISDGTELVGALVEFRRQVAPDAHSVRHRRRESPRLDGLGGKSAAWQAVCADAIRQLDHGLPLLVVGEPGVGKLSLAQALQARSKPDVELKTLDCALEPVDGASAWLGHARQALADHAAVLFRHLERLSPAAAAALAVEIEEALDAGRATVYATLTSAEQHSAECASLMERFPGRVVVPPLRQRKEDVPDIVATILRRRDFRPEPARFTPEATQVLIRGDWPQNIRQLENVVRAAVANSSGAEIDITALPRDVLCQATRRSLSPMERIELDAILAALERCGDNRTRAAEILGISRATLHRRLKAYGLQLDRSAY